MASLRGLWSVAQSLAGGPLFRVDPVCLAYPSMTWMQGQWPPGWVCWHNQAGRSSQYPSVLCSPAEGFPQAGGTGTCPTALSGSCSSVANGQNWALCSCHWGRADEAAWDEHRLGPSLCTGPNSWRVSARKGRPHSPTSVSETEKPQFMLIFYTLNAMNRLQQHRQPTRIKRFGPWGFFPPKTMITLL